MDVGRGVEDHVDDEHVKKPCRHYPCAELRELEPKLQDACNAYARTKGMTFMRPDSFRCEMEITYEMTLKKKAA